MNAAAGGIHQHRRRSVDHIARGHLLVARLQEVFFCHRRADRRHAAVDREDRTDRDVNVDVRGAIQRVHQHHVFGVFTPFEDDNLIFFFRGDPGNNIACSQCGF